MEKMRPGFITFVKNYGMDLGLTNKVIIITGGAKGIGEGISKVLAAEGAIVAIVGRTESDNLKTVKEIESNDGKAFSVVAELSNPAECEHAVKVIRIA